MAVVHLSILFLVCISLGFGEQKSFPLLVLEEKTPDVIEDEVQALEQLITTNERRLMIQKQLKQLMLELKQQKEDFAQGNQSKAHAFAMVTNARQILGIIKQEHLSYLFSPSYLEELVFFSSIAGKSTPVRP